MIKEVYTGSDGDKTVYECTYDENGNIIKEVYTESDGSTYFAEVEYEFVYMPYGLTERLEDILTPDF